MISPFTVMTHGTNTPVGGGGVEAVSISWLVDFSRYTPATLKVSVSAEIYTLLVSFTGTAQVRVGGTYNTADGTVVGTPFSIPLLSGTGYGLDYAYFNVAGTFSNPGGQTWVKLTAQTAGAGYRFHWASCIVGLP